MRLHGPRLAATLRGALTRFAHLSPTSATTRILAVPTRGVPVGPAFQTQEGLMSRAKSVPLSGGGKKSVEEPAPCELSHIGRPPRGFSSLCTLFVLTDLARIADSTGESTGIPLRRMGRENGNPAARGALLSATGAARLLKPALADVVGLIVGRTGCLRRMSAGAGGSRKVRFATGSDGVVKWIQRRAHGDERFFGIRNSSTAGN